jgi:hypothetical protein
MNAITKKAVSSYVQFKKENSQWVSYWRGTNNRIKCKDGLLVPSSSRLSELKECIINNGEYASTVEYIVKDTEAQQVYKSGRA